MNAPREPRRQRRSEGNPATRLLLRLLVVGVLAFGVGYLFTALFLFGGARGDDIVTVPDLRGRPQADAVRLAQQEGLLAEVGESLINPEVPEGYVLAQSPLPGEEVAPGSLVRLTLSAGRDRRPVPQVGTLTGEQARQLLTRAGFDVVVEERTDHAPAGRLLSMDPPPGTRLELPASVRLVVSAGPPPVELPLVIGLDEHDARAAIEEAGLRVGEVTYESRSLQPQGTVISQTPSGGMQLPVGSSVNLVLAGRDPWNL
jgi:eukaryotic-like serine/threonine-protein kinase